MLLNYPQESNGMYKLYKGDFDDIALMLLREYVPNILYSAREVDIDYIIKECYYLEVMSKRLTADASVLGLIAFEDDIIPCYSLNYKPTTLNLKGGTIVIDISLSGIIHTPRRRFTLAHEFSHWILHRSYHSPINQVFAFKRTKYLSCNDSSYLIKEKPKMSESEKEEWQANSLAAAILMPKFTFIQQAYVEIHNRYGLSAIKLHRSDDPIGFGEAVKNISEIFNVSLQATEIRLEQLDLVY